MSGMITAGVATAVVGGAIQSENAKKAAKSAGDAANAQAAAAGQQRDLIMQQAEQNRQQAMSLAQATPQELQALDHSYQTAQSNLDRESRLLAAIDPSMMEASKQALSLLRGENGGYGAALADQRKMQRQQLINQLKAAYGPDAETSSIGQKALQSFDMQTNTMVQQANQGALGQAFGIATSDVGGRARAANAQLMQAGQGFGALQDRQLNTQINTGNGLLNALSGTSSSMIQAAGAPYVQGTLEAQGNAALGGSIMGIGGSIAGYGLMGSMMNKNVPQKDPMMDKLNNSNWNTGAQAGMGNGGWGAVDAMNSAASYSAPAAAMGGGARAAVGGGAQSYNIPYYLRPNG